MSAALQEIGRYATTVNDIKLAYPGIKTAVMHGHTNIGDGVLTPQQAVDRMANRGIDTAVLTEHKSLLASDIAIAYAQDMYPWFEMYRGQEVETNDGHVLFIARKGDKGKEIPSQRSIIETAKEIRDRGGLFVIAHPGNTFVRSAQKETFYQLADAGLRPDATERAQTFRFPSRIGRDNTEELTRELEEYLLGADVLGSDFHGREPVKGVVVFEADTLFGAIQEKETKGVILQTRLPDGRTIKENYKHYKDCALDYTKELWRRATTANPEEVTIYTPSGALQKVA